LKRERTNGVGTGTNVLGKEKKREGGHNERIAMGLEVT